MRNLEKFNRLTKEYTTEINEMFKEFEDKKLRYPVGYELSELIKEAIVSAVFHNLVSMLNRGFTDEAKRDVLNSLVNMCGLAEKIEGKLWNIKNLNIILIGFQKKLEI